MKKKRKSSKLNYCNWLAAFSSDSMRSNRARTVGDMLELVAQTGPGEAGAELGAWTWGPSWAEWKEAGRDIPGAVRRGEGRRRIDSGISS